MELTPAIIILGIAVAGLLYLFIKKALEVKHRTKELENIKTLQQQTQNEITQRTNELDTLKSQFQRNKDDLNNYIAKYKDIIDVDKALTNKNDELKIASKDIDALKADYEKQKVQLNDDFVSKRNIYENLLKEISIVEENLENISYGLYKPHYDYQTSEEYKQKLEEIWNSEKEMIKADKATYCPTEWTVSGSLSEGKKMIKHQSKLMLRAFNGECDAAITKVSWSNIANVEARITKAYEAINNLGSTQNISITIAYSDLKLQELHLEFELQEKLYREKEEQRKIREQMREEEKAQRDMERARQNAEEEEERYQKALAKAKAEIERTSGAELDALNHKIKNLEENLQKAQTQKERAISQAQLTKSGHVYIISNIGSFGDHVYKIGMTRRLEPIDRINELGDASVPFDFDVHGMIYSENAPALENILHRKFEQRRLNLVNMRAEFFSVSIDEIEAAVVELNLAFQITKIAEAKEYRTTQSIREAKLKEKQNEQQPEKAVTSELEKFPSTLI